MYILKYVLLASYHKAETDDFCNISVRLEDHTFALVRQQECIALARSYKSMPIDEFDAIAGPLIMK